MASAKIINMPSPTVWTTPRKDARMAVKLSGKRRKELSPLLGPDLFISHRYVRLKEEEAVSKFKPLVKYLALKYATASSLELQDLESLGYEGVIDAVRKYCPEQSKYRLSQFASYVSWKVRTTICNGIDEWNQRDHHSSQRYLPPMVSLDMPIGEEGEQVLSDVIASPSYDLERQVLLKEMWRQVGALKSRQHRIVLYLRYRRGLTLAQVGRILGRSRQRIEQVEKDAICSLRRAMTATPVRRAA